MSEKIDYKKINRIYEKYKSEEFGKDFLENVMLILSKDITIWKNIADIEKLQSLKSKKTILIQAIEQRLSNILHKEIKINTTMDYCLYKIMTLNRNITQKDIDTLKEFWFFLKSKISDDRKKGFGGKDNFIKWFFTQKQECHYCQISQTDLITLFTDKIKSKKLAFSAILQIDKKDSNKGYNKDNCVLACCLCNNAKSDMISYDDFKNIIAPAMTKYYEYLKSKGNK